MLTLHLPCARGTEMCVDKELNALGATEVRRGAGVVRCAGSWDTLARANVFSRCASKVLVELAVFEGVATEADLVDALAGVPFEERLDDKGTFAIEAHLIDCAWTNAHYAAQRTKDAVLDRLRAQGKGRPSVDRARPSLRFVLHWHKSTVTLSLDSTGEPLHQRGYRRGVEGHAPMKETLAASLLAVGHADVARPFLDPCCGTGTLAIEQAWRALERAPGRDRRFGFERWSKRPPELDRALAQARTEARERERRELPAPIRMSDWHRDAVAAATTCIEQAGLGAHLRCERQDAREAVAQAGEGAQVVSNLPFGERLGGDANKRLQLEGFYRTLGERLRALPGARVLLFSAHPRARELLALDEAARTKRDWALRSGALPARLFRWDLP
ncbi:MAG: hypothetical protein IT383_24380 [Deltaproteobacteria bacterium]|nr:hypothetical protein [Deltaproteobacteria bacterium]